MVTRSRRVFYVILGANRDIRTIPQVQCPWDKPNPRDGARRAPSFEKMELVTI